MLYYAVNKNSKANDVALDGLVGRDLVAASSVPVYTVIAEKLHAIALLGMTNSRMKDYLDLSVLLERESLDIDLLNQQSEMFIQGRDGQIRERNSYGDDPFPPKG